MKNTINHRWIDTVEKVQIDVKNLKVGMFVSELDRPWLESTFWFQGFELRNQSDIEEVQKQCEYVFIDVGKSTKVANFVSRSTGYGKNYLDDGQPRIARSTFKQEIKKAEVLHRNTSKLVKSFMEDAKFGRPINTVVAKKAVASCVDTILNSPDTLMLMAQLKKRDEYTAQHSMNVCIYSIALGRHINLFEHELNNIGLCGMMHDMGKMLIPPEILNKPGRLSDDEMAIMQSHAFEGWRILLNTSGMFAGAVDVAYTHHERMDGKGYPRKLTAEQITPFAQMVAIVDMYDAITSDRVYQKGKSHLDAIKILTECSNNGHLNPQLTMKFIECIGIYPVGSLVELVSGEVAIVFEANQKAKLKPKIMMLLDANKNPCNEFVADLSMISHNTGGKDYRIKQILRAEECGVDLLKYYESGFLDRGLANESNPI